MVFGLFECGEEKRHSARVTMVMPENILNRKHSSKLARSFCVYFSQQRFLARVSPTVIPLFDVLGTKKALFVVWREVRVGRIKW